MSRMKAIYHAPPGDERVLDDWHGVRFYDGQPVDLNSDEHAVAMGKIPKNQHFTFETIEDEPQFDDPEEGPSLPGETAKKRGRPTNAVRAARAAAEQDED